MGSPVVTAPASAPAAAPSTPAPAAPVSTPSTPAGGAPASSPSAPSPSAPSAPLSTEERLAEGWAKAKAAVEVAEPEVEVPEVVEPVPEVVEPEPEPAAGEAEPATEPEPVVAEPEPEPGTGLDDGEVLTPKAFGDYLKEHPEAAKALDANPELKHKVFAALRRDQENRDIRQYIPDVETAKTVTKAAATFQSIDNHFVDATTPEGATAFLNHWVKEAMITDDQGQPVLDANGKYQLHPALGYTFNHIFNNKISVLAEQAQNSGNERLAAALDVIREETSPTSQATDEIPEELRPHADRLAERERSLTEKEQASARQERERQQVANEQSMERAESKAADSIQASLKPLFAKSSLSSFEQQAALEKIGALIDEKLSANSLYQSTYDSILKRPASEEREKALTAHMLKYTQEILGPIAASVIREAKGGAVDRQTATQNKVAEQKRASTTDPKGASVAVVSTAPQTLSQMRTTIINEYKQAHGGEEPEQSYIIAEGWKRFNAQKARK